MFTIPILETDQSIRKKERYAKRIVPHKKLIKSLISCSEPNQKLSLHVIRFDRVQKHNETLETCSGNNPSNNRLDNEQQK